MWACVDVNVGFFSCFSTCARIFWSLAFLSRFVGLHRLSHNHVICAPD